MHLRKQKKMLCASNKKGSITWSLPWQILVTRCIYYDIFFLLHSKSGSSIWSTAFFCYYNFGIEKKYMHIHRQHQRSVVLQEAPPFHGGFKYGINIYLHTIFQSWTFQWGVPEGDLWRLTPSNHPLCYATARDLTTAPYTSFPQLLFMKNPSPPI